MNNFYHLASLGKNGNKAPLAMDTVSEAQWPGLAASSLASLSGLNSLSRNRSLVDSLLLKARGPSQIENVFMGSLHAKAASQQRGADFSSLLTPPFPLLDVPSQRSGPSALSLALAPDHGIPSRDLSRTSVAPTEMSRTASLALLRSSLQTRRAERLAEALKLQREEAEVARAIAISSQFDAPARKRSFSLAAMQEPMFPSTAAGAFDAPLAPPAMKKQRREGSFLCAQLPSRGSQQSFSPIPRSERLVTEPSSKMNLSPVTTPSESSTSSSNNSKLLSMACDEESLTPYQCLARKQIEIFAAEKKDVDAKGRNRSIVQGQVGIRCIHCAHLPARERSKGSTIYPSKLEGIYQAAQNMANSHISKYCQNIPVETRDKLLASGNKKSSAGGGKEYWSTGAKILGVGENDHGLCFLQAASSDS
ncbi:expressed unknown protein [Seminavis robusta]|uniref:Uncharacterized protein n=1 Tax=Seminavis robusta TaxID=568900 RepID=A0A9N8F2G4_9STRA|nr:expressed unknown protein [Seminavis robusta]|eukprot:Sro2500_g329430.1 n/a (421) ;mRNA; r:7797-9157